MQVFMQTRPVTVMDKTENTHVHASNFGTDAFQSTRAGIPGRYPKALHGISISSRYLYLDR